MCITSLTLNILYAIKKYSHLSNGPVVKNNLLAFATAQFRYYFDAYLK